MENLSVIKKNYIEYINQIILNNKISHSYLIEVDNYEEDFQYVLSFIKMILCNTTFDQIDSNNSIVSLIDTNNYPDLYVLEPEQATFRKNQVLDLKKEFQNTSLLNGKRIYIIKYAEKFNLSSSNSILKFLEEPEDDIIAFLLTDNRYHVIDTILSRCQVLSLKEYHCDYIYNDNVDFLLSCFVHPNLFFKKYHYIVENLFVDKNNFLDYMNNIETIFLNYLHYKFHIIDFDFDSNIVKTLDQIDFNQLLSYISIIEKEKDKLEFNVNFKLFLDSFYSKLIMEVI